MNRKRFLGFFFQKRNIILYIFIVGAFAVLFPRQIKVVITPDKEINILEMRIDTGRGYQDDTAQRMSSVYGRQRNARLPVFNILSVEGYRFDFDELISEESSFSIRDIKYYAGDIPIFTINAKNIDKLVSQTNSIKYSIGNNAVNFNISGDNPYITFETVGNKIFRNYLVFVICYVLLLVIALMYCSFYCIKKNEWLMTKLDIHLHKFYDWILVICISGGIIICGLILSKLNQRLRLLENIQTLEIFFMTFALALVYICSYIAIRRHFSALAIMFMVSFFVYFSIERLTVYLSTDEDRAIREQLYLSSDTLRHWRMGNARTNYLTMGTILKLIPDTIIQADENLCFKLAKLMHWICGFGLVSYCVFFIQSKYIKLKKKSCYNKSCVIIIIYAVMLSLPLFLMTIKNYNYDLFCLLFSCISLLQMIWGYKSQTPSYCIAAIAAAALAMQEKMQAMPIFLLSLIAFVVCCYLRKQGTEGTKKQICCVMKYTFLSYVPAFLIFWFSSYWVGWVLRSGDFPPIVASDIIKMFSIGFEFIIKDNGFFGNFPIFKTMLCVLIMTIAVCLSSVFIIKINRTCKLINQNQKHKWNKVVIITVLFSLITIYLLGIAGNYILPDKMGSELSFFQLVWKGYSMQTKSIPVLYLFLMIYAVILYKKRNLIIQNIEELIILFLFYVGIIPLYSIAGISTNDRYLNLFILLDILLLIIIFLNSLYSEEVKYKKAVCPAILAILLADTSWFGPAYTSYFPVWNVSPVVYNSKNSNKQSFVTKGWGEYLGIAGENIEKYCRENQIDLEKGVVYYDYRGWWTSNNYGVQVLTMPGGKKLGASDNFTDYQLNDFSVQDNSFYIFSSAWSIFLPYNEMPQNVTPIITIKERGREVCWIYQGSQLKSYFADICQ